MIFGSAVDIMAKGAIDGAVFFLLVALAAGVVCLCGKVVGFFAKGGKD